MNTINTQAPAATEAPSEDMVMVSRDLLGAACSAIDKKRDAPTVLAKLRAITMAAPAVGASPESVALRPMEFDDGRKGWYVQTPDFYLDIEPDQNGKWSAFFRDSAGKEAFADQAAVGASVQPVPVAYSEGRTLHWHAGRGITDAQLYAGPVQPVQASLSDEHHGLDTAERVCFYEQDFYVLSNFSSFSLVWFGLRFDTSEAAYHWMKFQSEGQEDLRHEILMAPSAHEAFKIAERNKPQRREDWDAVKVGIMRDILRAKAAQHEYVRRKLLDTGDRLLVENSWRDDYWGWGPNRDGQNMLGKLWMEVRAELRAALASSTPTKGGQTS